MVQQVFEDILKRIDRQIAKLPDPIEEPVTLMKDVNPALAAGDRYCQFLQQKLAIPVPITPCLGGKVTEKMQVSRKW